MNYNSVHLIPYIHTFLYISMKLDGIQITSVGGYNFIFKINNAAFKQQIWNLSKHVYRGVMNGFDYFTKILRHSEAVPIVKITFKSNNNFSLPALKCILNLFGLVCRFILVQGIQHQHYQNNKIILCLPWN